MNFKVVERFGSMQAKSTAYLTWDDWNDYSFTTLYGLVYLDKDRVKHDIGGVKIARVGLEEGIHPIKKGEEFKELKQRYFSLGTSDEYYENLNKLGNDIRDEILIGLHDIAKSQIFYDLAKDENVTQTSLFRHISPSTVTGQYRRIANGGTRLTNYNFRFILPKKLSEEKIQLSFEVVPESLPPTNIHAIIGRNGVGKTHLLNNMINSLLKTDSNSKQYGKFENDDEEDSQIFANLVSVSFSAFDETEPQPERKDKTENLQYYYIGLKRQPSGTKTDNAPKSTIILRNEFLKSLNACKLSPKNTLWRDAITTLESDTNFKDSEVKQLIELDSNSEEYKSSGAEIFRHLSSGHKIILLTITRLIETVQEKTLVLVDEPEAHLHPPLLSSFIRALSDLLTKTNGVAIIATHSPVILQEIPKSCVWKIRRNGENVNLERLAIESFGENVGTLTSEVFGLEVTTSGFYNILNTSVKTGEDYQKILAHFNGQLGMEARAILMALIADQNAGIE